MKTSDHSAIVEFPRRKQPIVIDQAGEERWSWPSFGWGVVTGAYVGIMITCIAAYCWSFHL